MLIERATVEDANEILTLQRLAYKSEAEIYNDHTIGPLKQTLEEIEVQFRSQTFLKASVNGRIVGSVRAYVSGGTCFIGRLIVHPEWRSQGIGTRLTAEIEDCFSQADRFELFTGGRSERNLQLYRKLGYRIIRSERITDDLTLVYMEKHRSAARPGRHVSDGS